MSWKELSITWYFWWFQVPNALHMLDYSTNAGNKLRWKWKPKVLLHIWQCPAKGKSSYGKLNHAYCWNWLKAANDVARRRVKNVRTCGCENYYMWKNRTINDRQVSGTERIASLINDTRNCDFCVYSYEWVRERSCCCLESYSATRETWDGTSELYMIF